MPKRSCVDKGYFGETYVIMKLIRDYNIVAVKVPQQFFSYDLITSSNKRLEVKTAILRNFPRTHAKYGTYDSYGWEFQRNPPQLKENASNYVVCVCFKSENFSEEPRCFVIPSSDLHEHSNVFKILANPTRGKRKFWDCENKWERIV